MTERDPSVAAECLLEAQRSGTLMATPSTFTPISLAEAYDAARFIFGERIRAGWRHVGWKVGFTNREIWPSFGLDRPIIAPMYQETVHQLESQTLEPVDVPFGVRAALRLEVEVVFGLSGGGTTEWVAVGVELVDCHYEGWRLNPADAVLDFGLHAGLVIGPTVPVSQQLLDGLPDMRVRLTAAAGVLAEGRGDAVLGSPVNVVRELTGSLQDPIATYTVGWEDRIGGEWVVTTGTMTPLIDATRNTTYVVESTMLPGFTFTLL